MKQRFVGRVLLVFGTILLFSTTVTFAAGNPKIGFVDGLKVIEQSKWGKQASDDFKREAEKAKAELEPKEKALLNARDELEKKKDVLDQKTKSKKEQELRDMYQEFQKLSAEASGKFEQLQAAMLQKARDAMRKAVEKIGKEEKYDYIFEKSAVVYIGSEKEDISQRVVTELDKLQPFK
jgi:outer membrane protein